MIEVSANIANLLHSDLDGEHAVKIQKACFIDEANNQVDFFTLWGRTIRRHYNVANTITTYYFIEGENLEIFNSLYIN